ncbi:hypothetical protein Zmor_013182 [Zophobas morio]|uniref:Uncharacterized protein n=1 Tax=Zophobas morio TaxID=2755281 RepID=A0AA38MF46_9CUCU|nr:hypothetical protein Zmor_013182 [Zophobas morio]
MRKTGADGHVRARGFCGIDAIPDFHFCTFSPTPRCCHLSKRQIKFVAVNGVVDPLMFSNFSRFTRTEAVPRAKIQQIPAAVPPRTTFVDFHAAKVFA